METLQRVYGISFPDSKLLKEYEKMLEEAAKRDHRKIGRVNKFERSTELSDALELIHWPIVCFRNKNCISSTSYHQEVHFFSLKVLIFTTHWPTSYGSVAFSYKRFQLGITFY